MQWDGYIYAMPNDESSDIFLIKWAHPTHPRWSYAWCARRTRVADRALPESRRFWRASASEMVRADSSGQYLSYAFLETEIWLRLDSKDIGGKRNCRVRVRAAPSKTLALRLKDELMEARTSRSDILSLNSRVFWTQVRDF